MTSKQQRRLPDDEKETRPETKKGKFGSPSDAASKAVASSRGHDKQSSTIVDVCPAKNLESKSHVEQKRARKREINRLSAERKRKREKIQLDAMHEMLQQLSQTMQVYDEDTQRLTFLHEQLVKLLKESALKKRCKQDREQKSPSLPHESNCQFDRGEFLEDIHTIERMISLVDAVLVDQGLIGQGMATSSGPSAFGTDSDENAAAKTLTDLLQRKAYLSDKRMSLIRIMHDQHAPKSTGLGNLSSSLQTPLSSHSVEYRLMGMQNNLRNANLMQYGIPTQPIPTGLQYGNTWAGNPPSTLSQGMNSTLPQVASQMDGRVYPFQSGGFPTFPSTAQAFPSSTATLQRLLNSTNALYDGFSGPFTSNISPPGAPMGNRGPTGDNGNFFPERRN